MNANLCNWFAARNAVMNYGLEAIQWNSGPSAAVQNTFITGQTTSSTCALNNPVNSPRGPTNQREDLGFGFVGNTVTGGRQGVDSWAADPTPTVSALLVSGNYFALSPPQQVEGDAAGAVADLWLVDRLNLSGNTLAAGGGGLNVAQACTNSLVLQNDFSGATKLGLDDLSGGGRLLNAVIAKNKLSDGVSFHQRAPLQDGTHYFLLQNTYLNTNGIAINPFLEPLALPVHYQP